MERINYIIRNLLEIELIGETCDLVKDESGEVIGATNFTNKVIQGPIFNMELDRCNDPNYQCSEKELA